MPYIAFKALGYRRQEQGISSNKPHNFLEISSLENDHFKCNWIYCPVVLTHYRIIKTWNKFKTVTLTKVHYPYFSFSVFFNFPVYSSLVFWIISKGFKTFLPFITYYLCSNLNLILQKTVSIHTKKKTVVSSINNTLYQAKSVQQWKMHRILQLCSFSSFRYSIRNTFEN